MPEPKSRLQEFQDKTASTHDCLDKNETESREVCIETLSSVDTKSLNYQVCGWVFEEGVGGVLHHGVP